MQQTKEKLHSFVMCSHCFLLDRFRRWRDWGPCRLCCCHLLAWYIMLSVLDSLQLHVLLIYLYVAFYAGVPFIQIPTTLLAMVDSSIGGNSASILTSSLSLSLS